MFKTLKAFIKYREAAVWPSGTQYRFLYLRSLSNIVFFVCENIGFPIWTLYLRS